MTTPNPVNSDQPLRKSAQRLRWFIAAFDEQVRQTEAETGLTYSVDRTLLAEVFADWLNAFQAQKPSEVEEKASYVGFAAGLMLRTLVRKKPVSVLTAPDGADTSNPAYFWPEGYLYVAFCLNVRGLVLEHDFRGRQELSDELGDTRTWWSFRENVEKDASLAIAFLDLFAGEEPDWAMPELFRKGHIKEIADRFYAPRLVSDDGDPRQT